MESLLKYSIASAMGLLSIFAPIKALIICAGVFVAIDFVTGVWASWKRAKKKSAPWAFESSKAWRTVTKLFFIFGGIVLAWMIDTYIVPQWGLKLANIFTGAVCFVEFWSYLENAAEISEHPVFRYLKKIMKTQVDEKLNANG